MTFATILSLVATYGPSIVPLLDKLFAAIRAGKANTEVTPEEWAELTRLATQSAEDIYRGLGVEPPPAVTPPTP